MTKIRRKVRDLWVERLESGKYKQGTGRLNDRNRDEFCCLGVLCEIAFEQKVVNVERMMLASAYGNDDDYEESVLPEAVMKWAGMDTHMPDPTLYIQDNPSVWNGSEIITCATANDNKKLTFQQIADKIKEWDVIEDED